jgi:predicted metalloprotease with PDZ domain
MSREAAFNDGAPSIDQTNSVNTFLTYYTYGQALGLGIDLSIRSQFPGRSLDDWMRAMWREHPDVDKAYTLADLQRTLASVTNADFARNMFASHIEGKEPMDYAGLLGRFGMTLEPLNPNKAWLGTVQLQFTQTGVRLSGPSLRGSPLYQAGVDRGDVIDSIDGKAIRVQKDLDDALAAHKPGDRVKLVLERRTGKAEIEVALMPAPELRIRTFEAAGRELPDAARALRDAWLSSKAIHPAPAVFKYCKGDARPVPFEYSKCPADGGDLFLTPR